MANNNRQSKKDFYWNLINTIIALAGLSFAFYLNHQQRIINKQHLNPNLSLMIYGGDNGANTIQIRNTSILPAVEIYIKKNVYFCSRDGKEIYAVESEYPGWHIPELLPVELKTKEITLEEKKQIIFEASLTKNWPEIKDASEPVIEFCVEFHRQSDMKKYSFRQMYFLKDLNLVWAVDASIKNDSYYSNLFRLVSDYIPSRKLPTIEELGKYKVEK